MSFVIKFEKSFSKWDLIRNFIWTFHCLHQLVQVNGSLKSETIEILKSKTWFDTWVSYLMYNLDTGLLSVLTINTELTTLRKNCVLTNIGSQTCIKGPVAKFCIFFIFHPIFLKFAHNIWNWFKKPFLQ